MTKLYFVAFFTFLSMSSYCQQRETIEQLEDRMTLANICSEDFIKLFKFDRSTATEKQTVLWLNQKLNAYIPEETTEKTSDPIDKYNSDGSIHYNYWHFNIPSKSVSISDGYIFITIKTICTDCVSQREKEDRVTIPIKDLKTVVVPDGAMSSGDGVHFYTFSNSIVVNGEKRDFYYIPMTFDKETNINVRLKKAFVHLVSFYWKKVKNQPF